MPRADSHPGLHSSEGLGRDRGNWGLVCDLETSRLSLGPPPSSGPRSQVWGQGLLTLHPRALPPGCGTVQAGCSSGPGGTAGTGPHWLGLGQKSKTLAGMALGSPFSWGRSQGKDVIPGKSWGLHLCGQRAERKDFNEVCGLICKHHCGQWVALALNVVDGGLCAGLHLGLTLWHRSHSYHGRLGCTISKPPCGQ